MAGPPAAAVESKKKGNPRSACSAPVSCAPERTAGPRPPPPASPPPPDSLRDDREVVEPAEVSEDRVLGSLVDGGRVVAAQTRPDDRLALRPRGQLREHDLHVLDGGSADAQPVVHRGKSS